MALLGLAVSGYCGYTLVGKITAKQGELTSKLKAVTDTENAIASLDTKIKEQKEELTTLDTKKKDLVAQIAAINDKLAEVKRKAEGLDAQVKEANDKALAAEKDLKDKTDKYGDVKPDVLRAEIAKLEQEVAALEGERKVLEVQEKELVNEAAKLRKAVAVAAQGGPIPGVSGKVTAVNRTWNYATVNVGTHEGVAPNGVLHVYRGRTFVGKLRVISVEAHSSTANVLREESAKEIQVGDEIMN
ncbi:MAG TPA: hypothetical protein VK970_25865 [Candidatus Methylacidiphilales bacterium]|nr:hypothetical protein [Candidatus Methylacidiphilales bacterium]